MFSSLRANNQVYILHKSDPIHVDIATVLSVSTAMPTLGGFPQQPTYVVDVTVKVGDSTITYSKLPSNADVADWGNNGNLVVACSREAINNELSAMKQRSVEILQSVDYHKQAISTIEKIFSQLNPEYAERSAQQEEIAQLKMQIAELIKEIRRDNANND